MTSTLKLPEGSGERTARQPSILLIAEQDDLLADCLAAQLSRENVLRISPGDCGDLTITVRDGNCFVNRQQLTGLFFLALPFAQLAASYCPADQAFCDSELGAVCLAALNLPSLFALNRYGAEQWYDGLRWGSWRRTLQRAEILLRPFVVGCRERTTGEPGWMPYTAAEPQKLQDSPLAAFLGSALFKPTPSKTVLLVCGELLTAVESPTAQAVARVLSSIGIQLAEIALDGSDRVAWINAAPSLGEKETAKKAADIIARRYREYLSHR